MVRVVYIRRTTHERTTVADALDRYEREVVPLKKASTQAREGARIREVKAFFGQYSLAAAPDLVAEFRDRRLAQGKANNRAGSGRLNTRQPEMSGLAAA